MNRSTLFSRSSSCNFFASFCFINLLFSSCNSFFSSSYLYETSIKDNRNQHHHLSAFHFAPKTEKESKTNLFLSLNSNPNLANMNSLPPSACPPSKAVSDSSGNGRNSNILSGGSSCCASWRNSEAGRRGRV